MSDERPRPGGVFDLDLGGGTPLPDVGRVRKPTVALDVGPLRPQAVEPLVRPPEAPPRGALSNVPIARPSARPSEVPRSGQGAAPPPLSRSSVPPPLPERTVVAVPVASPAQGAASPAPEGSPNTGDPLGGAPWQGAGGDDGEPGELTEEDLCGVVVASHRLESRLGGGGFADVYLGRHEFLARTSAVKLLRRSLAASETTRRRFQREAEVLAALGHPNVVRLIDYGVLPSGRPFLVTELVEGQTLRTRLDNGVPIPPETALEWAKQLARGLAALHALGVVHRDLKPTNVMVSAKGELKILDLGIARWLEPGDRTRLTEAGRLLGTPKYSAPEQLLDPASAGPPADLYALGSILFEMLAGRPPFWGGERNEVMEEKRARAPEAPPGSTGMERIAVALLEPDPERRIGSAAELLVRLDDVQLGVPTQMLPSPLATQVLSPSVQSMPGAPVLVPSTVTPRRARSPRVWLLAGGAALVAFVVGVGVTVLVMRRDEEARVVPPVEQAPPPAEPELPAAIAAVRASPSIEEPSDLVEASSEDDAEDTPRGTARRTPRPAARTRPRDVVVRESVAPSASPTPAAARVIAGPSRAMTARGEIDAALSVRGLTSQDLPRLVDASVVAAWRAALGGADDAQIDATTRALVRAVQDASITPAVIDGQIRRVLAAVKVARLSPEALGKVEDRIFELRRDLISATALRREEIAREVTQLERRLTR